MWIRNIYINKPSLNCKLCHHYVIEGVASLFIQTYKSESRNPGEYKLFALKGKFTVNIYLLLYGSPLRL